MLTKIYNQAILKDGQIILDGEPTRAIIGKHAIWLPELQAKIVWSYHGKLISYRDWNKGRHRFATSDGTFNRDCLGWEEESLRSIANEYIIFEKLSERGMSPDMGGLFFIKNFISDFPYGAKSCDCTGVYGYFMENANQCPKGDFSVSYFNKFFLMDKIISASEGALGDVAKPDNTVNGYLIDIRRTDWDMMQYEEDSGAVDELKKDIGLNRQIKEELMNNIARYTQFPHKERKNPYQSYRIGRGKDEEYIPGSRDTLKRFEFMGISQDLSGKIVLDLGCQLGAITNECYHRGARKVSGLEYEQDYVECARDLARYNGQHINYIQMDFTKVHSTLQYINHYYPEPIDIVFALSLYKHLFVGNTNVLWEILNGFKWKTCYLESHNAPDEFETGHAKEMLEGVKRMGCKSEYLGQDTTRSPRCVWRLIK